jgi:hypothetical protein
VILPNETYVLPRAAKVPEPKAETTWEKFAKEKGITKKKRERMVYDENNQEYRPRFGYKRANNGIEEIPIVEVKKGQDPFADPWAEAKNDKKQRVKKNTKNMLRNQGRANGTLGKSKSYGEYLFILCSLLTLHLVCCEAQDVVSGTGCILFRVLMNSHLFLRADPEKMPGIPLDMGKDSTMKRGKNGLKRALQLVQHSTASMGRFVRMPG